MEAGERKAGKAGRRTDGGQTGYAQERPAVRGELLQICG